MSGERGPRKPSGLKKRGAKFWGDIAGNYDLSGSELEILTETCRILDRLELLNADIEERGATVAGSQGQEVLNPSLQEARQQEVILHRLLVALAIPDEETGETIRGARSQAAQAANDTRWGKRLEAV